MEQLIDLKRLRFEQNLSQQKLGDLLNVTKQQISNIESGKSKLTADQKEILIKNFGDILQSQMNESTPDPKDCITVDYYPEVYGSCGGGTLVVSEQKELIQVPKKFFTAFSPVKKYSVVKAKGESMRPTLQPDDKIIIEHWSGEQIIDNEIYIFCYKDEIFVKRLIKNVDEIIILSDNNEAVYRPRFIEKEEINNILIIGRIVGLMREF